MMQEILFITTGIVRVFCCKWRLNFWRGGRKWQYLFGKCQKNNSHFITKVKGLQNCSWWTGFVVERGLKYEFITWLFSSMWKKDLTHSSIVHFCIPSVGSNCVRLLRCSVRWLGENQSLRKSNVQLTFPRLSPSQKRWSPSAWAHLPVIQHSL